MSQRRRLTGCRRALLFAWVGGGLATAPAQAETTRLQAEHPVRVQMAPSAGTIPPSGELWFDNLVRDVHSYTTPALRAPGRALVPLADQHVLSYRDLPAGPIELFDLREEDAAIGYHDVGIFRRRWLTVDPAWSRPPPAHVVDAWFESGDDGRTRGVVVRFGRPLLGLEAQLSDGVIERLLARPCRGPDAGRDDRCVTVPSLHLVHPPPYLAELRVVELDAHRSAAADDAFAIVMRTYEAGEAREAAEAEAEAGASEDLGACALARAHAAAAAGIALLGLGLAAFAQRRRARRVIVPS